jgi:hypothetical protein
VLVVVPAPVLVVVAPPVPVVLAPPVPVALAPPAPVALAPPVPVALAPPVPAVPVVEVVDGLLDPGPDSSLPHPETSAAAARQTKQSVRIPKPTPRRRGVSIRSARALSRELTVGGQVARAADTGAAKLPIVPSLPRRAFLKGLASAAALGVAEDAVAAPDGLSSRAPPDLTVLDLTVEGDKKLAQRFTLFIPKHLASGERVPLLVLLHGLGETGDPTLGVFAWVERYGLGTAYARLRRPPITRTSRNTALLPDAHIAELNATLAAHPFRGMAIACPFTPNIGKTPNPTAAFDAYAAWITEVVVPRARKEAPVFSDAAHTYLDGVSLGGYIGLEVFIRRPDAFGAWGGVQSAFNIGRLRVYADALAVAAAKAAKGGKAQRMIHIETSVADPFHDINLALSTELKKKGVPHDFVALPGPHDQPFLREAGTMEMLLWHARRTD